MSNCFVICCHGNSIKGSKRVKVIYVCLSEKPHKFTKILRFTKISVHAYASEINVVYGRNKTHQGMLSLKNDTLYSFLFCFVCFSVYRFS